MPKRIRVKTGVPSEYWYSKCEGEVFVVINEYSQDKWRVENPATASPKAWSIIHKDYAEPLHDEPEQEVKHSQYKKQIRGVTIDVYDVLRAFGVTNPATAHAVKKLLRAGTDHNDRITDLRESMDSLQRAIELEEGR